MKSNVLAILVVCLPVSLAVAEEPASNLAPVDQPACCFAEEPGHAGSFWARADYLLWWTKSSARGPFVTTGTVEGAGIFGEPGTRVLFGDSFDPGVRSGGRITFGCWLDSCESLGLQSSGLILEKGASGYSARSDAGGNPTITLPVSEPGSIQDGYVFGLPGLRAGGVAISSSNRLWGWETNAVTSLGKGCNWRAQMLAGFRTLGLSEDLRIGGSRTPLVEGEIFFLDGTLVLGDLLIQQDAFQTRNHFYGGQLGGQVQFWRGPLCLDLAGKLALGSTRQTVKIAGSTDLFPVTGPDVHIPVGLFALHSNSGNFHTDEFSVVPELNIRFGYQVTECVKATIGYTFLYWSSVARASGQFNPESNNEQAPTGGNFTNQGTIPPPPFNHTDFWAQGLDFGLELTF